MTRPKSSFTRRNFIAAAGLGAVASALPHNTAHADLKETETANEKVVLDMCKAIESVDVDKIAPFIADDIVFQLIDGQPLVEGKEAFLAGGKQFFANFERAEFIVHRSHVMGNLVINERTDKFHAKEGGTDQSFHVTGFFVVKDGKIHEWRDYMVPK